MEAERREESRTPRVTAEEEEAVAEVGDHPGLSRTATESSSSSLVVRGGQRPTTPVRGRTMESLPMSPALAKLTPSFLRAIFRKEKTMFDRLYDSIRLPGLLVAAMDTAEFQRLDRIGQLGGSSYVYPSATHTRKEHSIGVAYLAGCMVRHLMSRQPELGITEDDVRCVQLAGLCHDIGHGPYSHMFDSFLSQVVEAPLTHEARGAALVKRVCFRPELELDKYFDQDTGITFEQHVAFTCSLIEGLSDECPPPDESVIGRPASKRFLYDVVANHRSGLDVDKFDYLLRDTFATMGTSKQYDVMRLITGTAVRSAPPAGGSGSGPDIPQIVFEAKLAGDINDVFVLRSRLHRSVYQHRVSNVAEAMITDALVHAEHADFRLRNPAASSRSGGGADDEPAVLTLSQAAQNLDAFVHLTDSILDVIRVSPAAGLEKAHHILNKLATRDFYRLVQTPRNLETLPACVACGRATEFSDMYCAGCGASTRNRARKLYKPPNIYVPDNMSQWGSGEWARKIAGMSGVSRNDFHVDVIKIKHGAPQCVQDPYDKNVFWHALEPLANARFYNPKAPLEPARKLDPSSYKGVYSAQRTLEVSVFLYYKSDDPDHFQALAAAYDALLDGTLDTSERPGNFNTPVSSRQNSVRGNSSAAGAAEIVVPGRSRRDDDYDVYESAARAAANAAAAPNPAHAGHTQLDEPNSKRQRIADATLSQALNTALHDSPSSNPGSAVRRDAPPRALSRATSRSGGGPHAAPCAPDSPKFTKM